MTIENKSDNHSIFIRGSADDSIVISGHKNDVKVHCTNVFNSVDIKSGLPISSQQMSKKEYRLRSALLAKVHHAWIKGVLEKSLHNQLLIKLGLEKRSESAAFLLDGVEQFKALERSLPESTRAVDCFDALGAGRTLLILGEPGAGKTTTLLRLVQVLITRLGDDVSQSIPVVLHLSTWTEKNKTFGEWLIQELKEKYKIRKATAENWIEEQQLTLCLDGLDEVPAQHRPVCVNALNRFIQNHGMTEIVVCSRLADYEKLAEQLHVRDAIYVKPLTAKKIDFYIEQAGDQLSLLRTVLAKNSELKKMASSPLILSIMSLVYKDASYDGIGKKDATAYRRSLFDEYVKKMLNHRGKPRLYSTSQTKRWLHWMACQTTQKSQSSFLVEQIQPNWLGNGVRRYQYSLESGLVYGGVVGLAICFIAGWSDSLNNGTFMGLVVGSISGLVVALQGDIQTVETLSLAGQNIRSALLNGLFYGLFGGLLLGFVLWIDIGSFLGLVIGVIGGLVFRVFAGLIGGVRGPRLTVTTKTNHGIWNSIQNACILSITCGTFSALLSMFIDDVNGATFNTLVFGLTGGLFGGATACLRHFSLRYMLWRLGVSPWNYDLFLKYATERLFLQEVGDGHIFVHRMLREHFAQMNPKDIRENT